MDTVVNSRNIALKYSFFCIILFILSSGRIILSIKNFIDRIAIRLNTKYIKVNSIEYIKLYVGWNAETIRNATII